MFILRLLSVPWVWRMVNRSSIVCEGCWLAPSPALITGTEATSSKETSIDVIVSDYSGVQDIILAEGVCSVQTIFSGYYYELDNYAENKYSHRTPNLRTCHPD